MANYSKSTDFAAKDALPTGNAGKIVKGTEIDDEFNAIQTSIATKAELAGSSSQNFSANNLTVAGTLTVDGNTVTGIGNVLAWGFINSSGTLVAGEGCTSVRTAEGTHTVTLDTDYGSSNYAVSSSIERNQGSAEADTFASDSFRLRTFDNYSSTLVNQNVRFIVVG